MSANGAGSPPAVLSVDVEDWFHVENLKAAVPRETWGARGLRVERNVERMLELMAAAGNVRATFFVLGWVAERCPALVRRIAAAGHEVASHGYGHELLPTLSPPAFGEDVRRSKGVLEDLASTPVYGYRAPSFSITEWAIPILRESGFLYDSSVFATTANGRYGQIAGVRPADGVVELAEGFFEVPVSCLTIGSLGLPWGGGGYFRLLPYRVFRRGVRHIRRRQRPYVFYIHPWEIDPDQPRVTGIPHAYRFRHYVGLGRCESRFESLLEDVRWSTASELVAWTRAHAESPAPA
jgi:polysaccharide deacetylase family protein (PEP-CTERM system associated)